MLVSKLLVGFRPNGERSFVVLTDADKLTWFTLLIGDVCLVRIVRVLWIRVEANVAALYKPVRVFILLRVVAKDLSCLFSQFLVDV